MKTRLNAIPRDGFPLNNHLIFPTGSASSRLDFFTLQIFFESLSYVFVSKLSYIVRENSVYNKVHSTKKNV